MLLISTALQGAADAFVQVSLNTGLSAALSTGLKIDLVQIEYPSFNGVSNTANMEVALSRGSKAAMPLLSDDDVLYKDKRSVLFVTSGISLVDNIIEYKPSEDVILIEEQLYFMFDTNASGVVNSAVIRIYASPIKVSTDDRIAILQSRIN